MDSSNQEARADSLFAAGRLSEAAQLYRGILRNAPGRLDIQTRVGRLALLENNPQEAIDHLAFVLNNGMCRGWRSKIFRYKTASGFGRRVC